MFEALKQFLNTQQFAPGLLALWINPFYLARSGLHREVAKLAPLLDGQLLDVGCGQKPYCSLFLADAYVGLELDTPQNRARKRADYFYNGGTFPFADKSFDSVVCNQVFEHIFTPEVFLTEIQRVLKPGGKLMLTVPFVWDEHEQPWDYARYTTFGLKHLLQVTGFRVLEQRKTNANVSVIFQLINAYLYKILWTRMPWLNLLTCMIFMSPFNILGAMFSNLLPANPDLYLDQIVLAERTPDV